MSGYKRETQTGEICETGMKMSMPEMNKKCTIPKMMETGMTMDAKAPVMNVSDYAKKQGYMEHIPDMGNEHKGMKGMSKKEKKY